MRRTRKPPPPLLPLLTLSLTRVLFTKHFHRGKNQAVPFSQGSAFLLFNTVHVFSISVERRLSDLPKPSESRCLGVSEDIGKAHKQQQQWRQRDRGGSSWKTSRRWSPSRRSRRQASLFHFPRRIYWVKFGTALEQHQNYSSPSVNVGGGVGGAVMDWVCRGALRSVTFCCCSCVCVCLCMCVRASVRVFLQCNTTWPDLLRCTSLLEGFSCDAQVLVRIFRTLWEGHGTQYNSIRFQCFKLEGEAWLSLCHG